MSGLDGFEFVGRVGPHGEWGVYRCGTTGTLAYLTAEWIGREAEYLAMYKTWEAMRDDFERTIPPRERCVIIPVYDDGGCDE